MKPGLCAANYCFSLSAKCPITGKEERIGGRRVYRRLCIGLIARSRTREMTTRTLCLVKGGHRYVFRYSPGGEDDMLDAIMELAESDSSPIDWLDAATLSFQVTRNTAADCLQAMSPTDEQVF